MSREPATAPIIPVSAQNPTKVIVRSDSKLVYRWIEVNVYRKSTGRAPAMA